MFQVYVYLWYPHLSFCFNTAWQCIGAKGTVPIVTQRRLRKPVARMSPTLALGLEVLRLVGGQRRPRPWSS